MKSFNEWMKEVDKCTYNQAEVSIHDLADCPFWDWWNDELSPNEAANKAINNEFGYL